MAKARAKKKGKVARPLLMAAFFCEKILEEKDGVLTPVRIVDSLKVNKPPEPGTARGRHPKLGFITIISALVAFKSGEVKGERTLHLVINYPSGKKYKTKSVTLTFLGGIHGFNAQLVVPAPVEQEGVYWYEVRLDGKLVTKMPLRIEHKRQTSDAEPSEGSSENLG